MADTLNMLVHNKTVPKLIETNNFMIINGTLYQKSNLSSMKKAFSFGSNLGNNVLHISRSMHLMDDARTGHRLKESVIREDIYEENVSYCIVNNHYSNINNTVNYLIKFKETDDDISIENQFSIDNTEIKEILSITQDYIFISTVMLTNPRKYIYCIKKSDFTNAKTITDQFNNYDYWRHTTKRGDISKLYEDETYLYLISGGYSYAYGSYVDQCFGSVVHRINKITLENVSEVHNPGYDSGEWRWQCFEDNIKSCKNVDGILYFISSYYNRSNIIIFKINTNNNSGFLSYTMSDVNASNTNYSQRNDEYSYKQIVQFVKDDNLFYCIADETNSISRILDYQGLHKFNISDTFNLTYVKRINPSSSNKIISILFNDDYSIIIIGYYQSFDILIYEEETQDYVKVGKSFTGIKNVGLDSLNRLWYETTSGEIHVENFDDPQDVVVEFEKPYYSYLSGELETYVTFKARSATGVVPTGRYILRITTGNAYFKESGTSELVINYESMSQDDIHYPLMITGSKRIVCNVSFEKVW